MIVGEDVFINGVCQHEEGPEMEDAQPGVFFRLLGLFDGFFLFALLVA